MVDFDLLVGESDDPYRCGPGRQLVRELYPEVQELDHEMVLVHPVCTEKAALKLERDVAQELHLFES